MWKNKTDWFKVAKEITKPLDDKEYRYLFPLTLVGNGNTPEDAWRDAVEGFMADPGIAEDWTKTDM